MDNEGGGGDSYRLPILLFFLFLTEYLTQISPRPSSFCQLKHTHTEPCNDNYKVFLGLGLYLEGGGEGGANRTATSHSHPSPILILFPYFYLRPLSLFISFILNAFLRLLLYLSQRPIPKEMRPPPPPPSSLQEV